MSQHSLYDRDFYAWTQDQAAHLREVRDNRLDAAHLAEEVADLGRSQLEKVIGNLRQCLVHLVKAAAQPDSPYVYDWIGEAETFAENAHLAFSPGMRQRIDLDWIWRRAVQRANRALQSYGATPFPSDVACPFAPDDFLVADFDGEAALKKLQGDGFDPESR
jgi:hypothetical protein